MDSSTPDGADDKADNGADTGADTGADDVEADAPSAGLASEISARIEAVLRRILEAFDLAVVERQSLILHVPGACQCGRGIDISLTELFDIALIRSEKMELPALVLHGSNAFSSSTSSVPGERAGLSEGIPQSAEGVATDVRRLEYRLRSSRAPAHSPEGLNAPGLAMVERVVEEVAPLLPQVMPQAGIVLGSTAWSSWTIPCPHGVGVPLMTLGKRSLPSYCARTRIEGDLSLANLHGWPGIEACRRCQFYRGDTELEVRCAAPKVEEGGAGLSLELDIYRETGKKRRTFLPLGAALTSIIRAQVKTPGTSKAGRVDVKFVEGEASFLLEHSDAFMERWRYYWNGEHWIRKPQGASLHDWNKWGRRLEYMSAAEVGSLPPEGGWPPLLDLRPGRYTLRVLGVTWKVGRKGEPELEWGFRVLEGKARGRKVFRRSPLRTPTMTGMVMKDFSMLLDVPESELISPGLPGFDAQLETLCGRAVRARVLRKDNFTNLYLEGRIADRGKGFSRKETEACDE